MIPFVLLSNITQCIQCSRLVKFVDGDHVGIIEHIYFLELRCGSIFRCHHVQAHVAVV